MATPTNKAAHLFLIVIAMAAAASSPAEGASYIVGWPGGSWDIHTNLTEWASRHTFFSGDDLRFQYPAATHNVLEVTRASYDACHNARPIAAHRTGNDAVRLTAVAGTRGRVVTRYFVCGVAGHCAAGMRLKVDVRAKDVRCRGRGVRRRCRAVSSAVAPAARTKVVGDAWFAVAAGVVGLLLF